MTNETLHVFLDDSVHQLLSENGVDLVTALRDQGIVADSLPVSADDASTADSGTKEPVSVIILASAVGAFVLSKGIKDLIEAVSHGQAVRAHVERKNKGEPWRPSAAKEEKWSVEAKLLGATFSVKGETKP